MKQTLIPALVLAAAGASAYAQQYSAWLPAEQQFVITPGATYSTFDRFWAGKNNVENPPDGDRLDQFTTYLSFEYGLLKNFAADLTVGYTGVDTDSFGGDSDWGSSDTTLGLRYRLLNEFEREDCWPSIAVRVGAIMPGSYDENLPFSAGDGAGGYEGSLLLARQICPGFGVYGDIGYRFREDDVPDDLFGSAGIYAGYAGFTATLAYRHVQGTSGGDIDDPGFMTSFGFPQLKEINQTAEVGLGYTDPGDRHYQVFYARTIDGRNTGQKNIFGLSVSIPMGGK